MIYTDVVQCFAGPLRHKMPFQPIPRIIPPLNLAQSIIMLPVYPLDIVKFRLNGVRHDTNSLALLLAQYLVRSSYDLLPRLPQLFLTCVFRCAGAEEDHVFVANWSGPSTAVWSSEVVSAREELEEKPVVLGDRVGVVEDGGPPVEGIEDDFFGERGECEWGPVCAGVAAEGADVCCRSQSASTAELSLHHFVTVMRNAYPANPPHSSASSLQ